MMQIVKNSKRQVFTNINMYDGTVGDFNILFIFLFLKFNVIIMYYVYK